MDYTVHGILQARILGWVAFPFSKGSSQPRDQTQISSTAGRFFTSWPTREAQEYCSGWPIPSPGDLPNPGIEPGSPALQADSLPAEPQGKPIPRWFHIISELFIWSFPCGAGGKESACRCRSCKETQVQSVDQEDPLEEGMATHSSIPASRIPYTEDPVRLWCMELQRLGHDWSGWACMHRVYILSLRCQIPPTTSRPAAPSRSWFVSNHSYLLLNTSVGGLICISDLTYVENWTSDQPPLSNLPTMHSVLLRLSDLRASTIHPDAFKFKH